MLEDFFEFFVWVMFAICLVGTIALSIVFAGYKYGLAGVVAVVIGVLIISLVGRYVTSR